MRPLVLPWHALDGTNPGENLSDRQVKGGRNTFVKVKMCEQTHELRGFVYEYTGLLGSSNNFFRTGAVRRCGSGLTSIEVGVRARSRMSWVIGSLRFSH